MKYLIISFAVLCLSLAFSINTFAGDKEDVEAVIKKGCDVRAFVYYNSFNNWSWLDSLPSAELKNLDVFAGDIRDPNGVSEAMKGCDVVFHLAAFISIPFSLHSPDSYADTNIKGTLNVLQAARFGGFNL